MSGVWMMYWLIRSRASRIASAVIMYTSWWMNSHPPYLPFCSVSCHPCRKPDWPWFVGMRAQGFLMGPAVGVVPWTGSGALFPSGPGGMRIGILHRMMPDGLKVPFFVRTESAHLTAISAVLSYQCNNPR